LELGQLAVELGFNLGINGIVTFNKAVNVREVVAATPLERLLLETDSPYLTPMPYRGIENAPKYLPFVAEKIADVKGLPVETVLGQTWQNAMATFFPAELS
ncbi:TatD family hydrolase, partial [Wenyingzhuangia sp. 1_MG-2023]|nr:TatD family hydrolase [Wenyingzhuangia sp. 1_MG-2023]